MLHSQRQMCVKLVVVNPKVSEGNDEYVEAIHFQAL